MLITEYSFGRITLRVEENMKKTDFVEAKPNACVNTPQPCSYIEKAHVADIIMPMPRLQVFKKVENIKTDSPACSRNGTYIGYIENKHRFAAVCVIICIQSRSI